ncbi:MAG: bifunctional nuclease family protein [Muribaculaceae bacterium]|nr:bifunctional nuclease family protein [Muribaculaceae bacterium]
MDQRIRLELIGITYNQIESGVYALILQQVGTSRRIPIIIGFPEAQAIECKLQEINTPRPLTHDIMVEALRMYGIKLQYVMIRLMENGVFAADLHFTNGIEEKILDSRSSDAVALAIRTNAPIYTTEDVIRQAGFDPADKKKPSVGTFGKEETGNKETSASLYPQDASLMTMEQLTEAMEKAAQDEDYEEAARLKEEINKRKSSSEI